MTQIFLTFTTGAVLTWPDPGNWNPVNTVECVGSSGGGGAGLVSNGGGGGGGGGAYAKGTNLTPTFPAYYCVPDRNSGYFSTTSATNFNVNSGIQSTAAGCVSAQCGAGGANQAPSLLRADPSVDPRASGGNAGTAFFPTGFAGGAGGGGSSSTGAARGGGGGGAGGPSGAGANGAVGTTAGWANGGASSGGTVAGGTSSSAVGSSGTQWDSTHGTGGGGASNDGGTALGGSGGAYGGGAAGGMAISGANRAGGTAAPGLIIITYIPLVPPAGVQVAMLV